MFSNQRLEARLAASLLALTLTVTGCSSSGGSRETVVYRSRNAVQAPPGADATATAAGVDEPTATEAAISGAGSSASSSSSSMGGESSSILNPNAPRSYTVKRGDTLWDISNVFLKDAWLWPEIWYVNPQVQNPHLIYPGDQLALAYGADGKPQLRLERGGAARLDPRLRSSQLDGAIPTIPYSAIASFLARPTVLTAEQITAAPHVLAFRDGHMMGGAGHEIYVNNLNSGQNARYSVMHIGEELRDPDDGKVLGYQSVYTATATVTKPGKPSKAVLSDSARETLEGDRLIAGETDVPLNFVIGVPANNLRGHIISVIDGVELIGQYQIVAINRGTRHGLKPGHVLAVDQAGEVVPDRYAGQIQGAKLNRTVAPKVQLPDERSGTLLVFKTLDRVSYALVVSATSAMSVADVVRTP